MRQISAFAFAIAMLAILSPGAARAQSSAKDYTLTIKDHKFTPEELKVSANTSVVITVINEDAAAEEFESHALKVEKVIAGKSRGTVRVGPLKAGRYPFVGEFHESTAKGVIIAE